MKENHDKHRFDKLKYLLGESIWVILVVMVRTSCHTENSTKLQPRYRVSLW